MHQGVVLRKVSVPNEKTAKNNTQGNPVLGAMKNNPMLNDNKEQKHGSTLQTSHLAGLEHAMAQRRKGIAGSKDPNPPITTPPSTPVTVHRVNSREGNGQGR